MLPNWCLEPPLGASASGRPLSSGAEAALCGADSLTRFNSSMCLRSPFGKPVRVAEQCRRQLGVPELPRDVVDRGAGRNQVGGVRCRRS